MGGRQDGRFASAGSTSGGEIMTFDWTSSRRTFLRTIVVSAVVSAAPFSVLEAATQNGEPAVIDLPNGSRLRVKKVGDKQYVATREEGGKVVDEKPTGSFTGKNGEVVVLDQGKVMSVTLAEGARGGGADWFGAFWK
jgi:hypothetical protein